MLGIIMGVAIVVYCAWVGWRRKRDYDKVDKAFGVVSGVFWGLVISFVIILIMNFSLDSRFSRCEVEYDKVKLTNLVGSCQTEGMFFLGTGNVEGVEYYKYFYLKPDGGKQFAKLPADRVVLYEEERLDGYLTKVGEQRKAPRISTLIIPDFFFFEPRTFQTYAIHVPKGTIKGGFEVDLSKMR